MRSARSPILGNPDRLQDYPTRTGKKNICMCKYINISGIWCIDINLIWDLISSMTGIESVSCLSFTDLASSITNSFRSSFPTN